MDDEQQMFTSRKANAKIEMFSLFPSVKLTLPVSSNKISANKITGQLCQMYY